MFLNSIQWHLGIFHVIHCLRNKSWKTECVFSFNMDGRILPMLNLETHSGFHDYFDSDMSKSTNTVVYFDWKTVIYIYVCGLCRTQFMLPNSSRRYFINMYILHVRNVCLFHSFISVFNAENSMNIGQGMTSGRMFWN